MILIGAARRSPSLTKDGFGGGGTTALGADGSIFAGNGADNMGLVRVCSVERKSAPSQFSVLHSRLAGKLCKALPLGEKYLYLLEHPVHTIEMTI